MKQKVSLPTQLFWTGAISTVILFISSSFRHTLFQSGFFDLGIYDQVVYLMSAGKPPVSSLLGFHHMGNHAAWAVYPLSLLYKIYPSPYWLLAVQAISLSLGVIPTYFLAKQAGLKDNQAQLMGIVYLLYPLIFNVNLFEFHPEVMAVPAILTAILAARWQNPWGLLGFAIAIIWVLGCKAVLSLTVAAMGLWLLFVEKRRACGLFALFAGLAWFAIATQLIIPHFSNAEAAAVGRYSYLGNSVVEIIINIFAKPELVLGRIFSLRSLEYLFLVTAPLIWGLHPQHLAPLISAVPTILINCLSDKSSQRDLIHQYSLPIVPFLMVAVIASFANQRTWIHYTTTAKPKLVKPIIIGWTIIGFIIFAKYGFFWSRYLRSVDTWSATREAISYINTKQSVLTTHSIAPHLTHRQNISIVDDIGGVPPNIFQYDYILLNVRHPDGSRNPEFARNLVSQIKNNPDYQIKFTRDEVYLFIKNEGRRKAEAGIKRQLFASSNAKNQANSTAHCFSSYLHSISGGDEVSATNTNL